jgi:hypothetical protein
MITLSLGLALIALPARGQEIKQTPGSMITVTQCNPHQHAAGTPFHPWIDPYGIYHGNGPFPYETGFLEIAYANGSDVAAKEIDFGLVARGSLIATTKDVGTFSKDAKIDHEFSVDPEIFPIGTALPYCAVLRVKYADGTEWQNPNPPTQ